MRSNDSFALGNPDDEHGTLEKALRKWLNGHGLWLAARIHQRERRYK